MSAFFHTGVPLLLLLVSAVAASPQENSTAPDNQHDFDWEFGKWQTHLWKLKEPLSGSKEWAEYDGTTLVRKIWNGRANLVELDVDGPAGRMEALSLRLYNPVTQKWSLNFASSRVGTLGTPSIGKFENGRGEFYDEVTINNNTALVRFTITAIDADSAKFEQSFSADAGKTWEVNWIALDSRSK